MEIHTQLAIAVHCPHCVATMPTVRSPRSSRVEIIALDVYQRAEDAGQRITLPMCEQRLAEVRAHRPTCRCGLCGTMAKAKARNVFAVTASWQRWLRAHDGAIVIATARS